MRNAGETWKPVTKVTVIPAKAGIQPGSSNWITASAGMTPFLFSAPPRLCGVFLALNSAYRLYFGVTPRSFCHTRSQAVMVSAERGPSSATFRF